MDVLLKGILSGCVVSIVLVLARSDRNDAAGLFVLFPAITLLSYYFIGQSEGEGKLRDVVAASLLAFPVWIVFMGATYVALGHLDFRFALLIGTGLWLGAGGVYLIIAPS